MSTSTNGAIILDEVADLVARFVVLPSAHALHAVTLWCAHAHAFEAAEATPYLSVQSPEKRSGKTRLLEVLELLVPRPLRTAGVSEAALFRSLADEPPPTLLFDEVDAVFSKRAKAETENLRGILNAGHRRGATVLRVATDGRTHKVGRFSVFSAKVLAGIGEPPDTITDRSVVIRMQRRAPGENVDRFRYRKVVVEADTVRERLAEWCAAVVEEARAMEPAMPQALDDRAEDAWEPLVALADLAGGAWPERARRAAIGLSSGRMDADDGTLGVRLLADVRVAFDTAVVDRMPSAGLAAELVAMDEAPWGDLFGRPLDARALARRLRPFEVRPRVIRQPDGTTPRGYTRQQFSDVWERYCPLDEGAAEEPPEPSHPHVAHPQPQQCNMVQPYAFSGHSAEEGSNGRSPENPDGKAMLRCCTQTTATTGVAGAGEPDEEVTRRLEEALDDGTLTPGMSASPNYLREWLEAIRRRQAGRRIEEVRP